MIAGEGTFAYFALHNNFLLFVELPFFVLIRIIGARNYITQTLPPTDSNLGYTKKRCSQNKRKVEEKQIRLFAELCISYLSDVIF